MRKDWPVNWPNSVIRHQLVRNLAAAFRTPPDPTPEINRHVTIFVYDPGMPVSVNLQTVRPRRLAAVRREVAPGAVGSAWGPALGKVWEFIRPQPDLWTRGHNIFLYHHPTQPGALI